MDGKPFLVLGGELAYTASSSLEYMKPVWPRLGRMNLNTVLTAVARAWVEPEEGKFDFTLVDGLLDGARGNNLRIIFLRFGSWKDGISGFVPAWVKADQKRFPRVRIRGGKSIEVLSSFSQSNRVADGRWVPGRQLSGDDVLLNYDLAAAAAANQSGGGLVLSGDGSTIQRVKLYRYQ